MNSTPIRGTLWNFPASPGSTTFVSGDCLHGGHYADDLAAKQTEVTEEVRTSLFMSLNLSYKKLDY